MSVLLTANRIDVLLNFSCSVFSLGTEFSGYLPCRCFGFIFVNSARALPLKLLILIVHHFEELHSVLSRHTVAVCGYLVIKPLRRGTIECERMITCTIKVCLLQKNLPPPDFWRDGYTPGWSRTCRTNCDGEGVTLSRSKQLSGVLVHNIIWAVDSIFCSL